MAAKPCKTWQLIPSKLIAVFLIFLIFFIFYFFLSVGNALFCDPVRGQWAVSCLFILKDFIF